MGTVPAPRFHNYFRGSITCTKIRSKDSRRWFARWAPRKFFRRTSSSSRRARSNNSKSTRWISASQPYLQHFEQRLGTFQQHVDAQQERAVNDILSNWSKDKPFYEKVRGVMASGISSGAVPLKGGNVDLDGAYAFACAADPEIREQLYAERSAAERKRQSEQAERARRSSGSLAPFAPGSNNSVGPKKRPGSRSVRDSIHEAIDEAAGR